MSDALYRLLAVALCITASVAAPQSTQHGSDTTYVKLQPSIADHSITNNSSRESRIENIPLTIPNIDNNTNQSKDTSADRLTNGNDNNNYPDKVDSEFDPKVGTTNQPEVITNENINNSYSQVNHDIEPKDNEENKMSTSYLLGTILKKSNSTEIITADSVLTEATSDSVSDYNGTDHLASESRQVDSRVGDTTANYEEAVTIDNVIEEVAVITEVDEETTQAPSATLLPKISHFGKSTFGSYSNNLIGRSGKRGFKSKCKCEKIWNCTKLQISVPRCPEEYFLCCS